MDEPLDFTQLGDGSENHDLHFESIILEAYGSSFDYEGTASWVGDGYALSYLNGHQMVR